MPTGLIITGMHRSGTSAMARVCNLLGMDVGQRIVGSDSFNPTGHWEHAMAVAFNRRVLRSMGGSSGWVKSLSPKSIRAAKLPEFEHQIQAIIRADFSNSEFWGIKDPEISRLCPLWIPALTRLGIAPRFILMVRHPLEVAASLHRRNQFSLRKSLLLWLRYNLELEQATRDFPRSIVSSSQFVANWQTVIDKIQCDCQFQFPSLNSANIRLIDAFLNARLWHHTSAAQSSEKAGLANLALEAYVALLAPDTDTAAAKLTSIAAALADADTRMERSFLPAAFNPLTRDIGQVYISERFKYLVRPSQRILRGTAAVAAMFFG